MYNIDGNIELVYFDFSNHVDFIWQVRSVEIVSFLFLWNKRKCFLHWFFGTKRAAKKRKNLILTEVLSNKTDHNNFFIEREQMIDKWQFLSLNLFSFFCWEDNFLFRRYRMTFFQTFTVRHFPNTPFWYARLLLTPLNEK